MSNTAADGSGVQTVERPTPEAAAPRGGGEQPISETDVPAEARTDHDPAPKVVPAFDGFRGVAALMIVVYHCWGVANFPDLRVSPVASILGGSNLGVDMFFVISGFVLFLPVARTGEFGSKAAYAVRRVFRIVPAYYVYIIFVLVFWSYFTLPILEHLHPFETSDGVIGVFSHLSFSQAIMMGPLPRIFGYDTPVAIGPLAVTWSLTVEACFYLVLPFVAKRYLRRPLIGLATAIVLSIGWRLLMMHPLDFARNTGLWAPDPNIEGSLRHQLFTLIPALAGHFAIGMTLAWFVVKASRKPSMVAWLQHRWAAIAALAAAGAAVVATWWLWGHETLEETRLSNPAGAEDEIFVALFSSLLFAAAFGVFAGVVVLGPRWAKRPWDTKLFRFLGDISYGVFLWHFVAIWFVLFTVRVEANGPNWTFLAYLLATLGIAIPAAWLSHVVIEGPAMRLGRRISRRIEHRQHQAVAAAEAKQW